MVKPTSPLVFVVDDDVHLREALRNLFESVGMHVELFGSTSELLLRLAKGTPECCPVLDIRLPGVSGLDFQNQLAKIGNNIPIVFMTGHGDVPMSVRARRGRSISSLSRSATRTCSMQFPMRWRWTGAAELPMMKYASL